MIKSRKNTRTRLLCGLTLVWLTTLVSGQNQNNDQNDKLQKCSDYCNHHTNSCIIKEKIYETEEDYQIQLKQDDYARKYLNKINYVKSGSKDGKGDLDVTCLNCNKNTEGSLCQTCKKGYFDTWQNKRIWRFKNMVGTLDEKILKIEIDCQPCQCSLEGSKTYECEAYPTWGKNFIPKDNLSKSNMTVIEAGSCHCKTGYTGTHCDECDLKANFYKVKKATREKWEEEAKKANLPPLNKTCVEKCVDRRECMGNDMGAQCQEGHCICSWGKFGPWCEYDNAPSSGSSHVGFSFLIVLVGFW